jgi:hypothetical protein
LVNILTTGIKHEEEIGCIKIKEEKISYKPESLVASTPSCIASLLIIVIASVLFTSSCITSLM